MAAEVSPIMSNLPITSTHFEGGQRLTPIDTSEGGAALASLLNSVASYAESASALAGDLDLSAATAAAVKAANRGVTTNAGAARTLTLPDYAAAPDGWMHTMVDVDANIAFSLTVVHAGTDTINGVAGDVTLNAQGEWVTVLKLAGAAGWTAIGGAGVVPA